MAGLARPLFVLAFLGALLSSGEAARGQQAGEWTVDLVDPAGDVLHASFGAGSSTYATLGFHFEPRASGATYFEIEVSANGMPLQPSLDPNVQYTLTPCQVAGDDRPGTEILVTFRADASRQVPDGSDIDLGTYIGNRVLTLAPDTLAPIGRFTSPPNGTLVGPGETVAVLARVFDDLTMAGWQTGIKEVWLTSLTPAGFLERFDVSTGGPQPCDAKQWEGMATFSYSVPPDVQPGQEIILIAEIYDWAGNVAGADLALTLIVGAEEWVGTMRGTATEFELGRPGSAKRRVTVNADFSYTVTPVAPDTGIVSGRGTATFDVVGGRDGDCTLARSLMPSTFELVVEGVQVGNAVVLQLSSLQEATVRETQSCPGLQPTTFTQSGLPWAIEFPEIIGVTMNATDGATSRVTDTSGTFQFEINWQLRQQSGRPSS